MSDSEFRFGPFRLDAAAFRLWRDDKPIPLAPKALDLLLLLVRRPATLVSKDTIMRELWTDIAVTDNALTQVVSDLRQALGDSPAAPSYIETVPRRGFRFVGSVATASQPEQGSPQALDVPPVRAGVRETSSLDAYRAFTEGRLKLERMSPVEVPAAMADFARAVELDPRYAPPYVGMAHARYWLFEASRARNTPDSAALAAAIEDLQHAIDLDPDFAEAHAALALMLTSAWRNDEARAAGRRAVTLEPGNWRNHCRLAIAAWGDERIAAFQHVLSLYPAFAYAFYGIAMVHVARDARGAARDVLRQGIPYQDRQAGRSDRFPANGLHWLLGLLHLADQDPGAAHEQFDRELATGGSAVYAMEFAVNAHDGHGFALLAEGNPEQAVASFTAAIETYPDHVRSLAGLAIALERRGHDAEQRSALKRAEAVAERLRAAGRPFDGLQMMTYVHAASNRPIDAIGCLDELVRTAPAGYAAWLTPIEPLFAALSNSPSFKAVTDRIAARTQ